MVLISHSPIPKSSVIPISAMCRIGGLLKATLGVEYAKSYLKIKQRYNEGYKSDCMSDVFF